ncbi:MAG: polymerase subunit sigma-24 [Flavipsychrobacter sp.]|jgi:RNA polymerase sigma-70 factor (ECF subfamily)|nr:polymerase subunit sigma-24 [Flavipsychrobacter sp.]
MSNAMLLYAHHTDGELVDNVKSGFKACFEVLVRRHSQSLYRVGRMFGLDNSQIELLISETHLHAYQHLRRMRNRSAYRLWLITSMIHKCRAHMRTQTDSGMNLRDPSMLAARSACHYAERISSSMLVTNKLEVQLDELPIGQRTIFVLHKVEGYTVRETAMLLNTSEENVLAAMEQAKSNLRKTSRNWHYHSGVYALDVYCCESIVNQVMAKVDSRLLVSPAMAPRA